MSYNITVNYEIANNGTSPMALEKFVYALETNPTTIDEGGTATLNFVADGIYFLLQGVKALAIKVTGATATWTCKTPFTSGELVLSNPTTDVSITIKAKVNILPQEITKPFLIQKAFPVDTRLVLSKKEMREISDSYLPDTYFALCKDEGHFYLYNKSNELDPITGKFRLITEAVEVTIQALDGGEIV